MHELVELDLRLRPFQSARVPHDLLVGVAVAIGLDRGFRIPFRVRDEFGSVSASAAETLGMTGKGVAKLKVDVVE